MKMMRAGADLLVNGGGGKEHVELPIQRRSPLIIRRIIHLPPSRRREATELGGDGGARRAGDEAAGRSPAFWFVEGKSWSGLGHRR